MDPRALKDEAHRLFDLGRFRKAAEIYRQLIALSPSDPQLHLRIARCWERLDQVHAAVAGYRTAAALHQQVGHLIKARATLRMALDLAPHDAQTVRQLAAIEGHPVARGSTIAEALAAATELPTPTDDSDSLEIEVEIIPDFPAAAVPTPQLTLPQLPSPAVGTGAIEPSWMFRIDGNTIALRRPDGSGWWLVQSAAPIQVTTVEDGQAAFAAPRPHLSVVA